MLNKRFSMDLQDMLFDISFQIGRIRTAVSQL